MKASAQISQCHDEHTTTVQTPSLPTSVVDRILRYASCDSIEAQAFYARTSALLRTAQTGLSSESGDKRVMALQVFCKRLQEQDDTINRIDILGESYELPKLATLAHAIAQHKASTDICMNACSLGNAKASYLFEALMRKPRIVRLSLALNRLGKDSLRVLVKLIAIQRELTHLDLSYNGFGEAGLCILMDALREHPNLINLRFRHCGLRTESLNALEDLLARRREAKADLVRT